LHYTQHTGENNDQEDHQRDRILQKFSKDIPRTIKALIERASRHWYTPQHDHAHFFGTREKSNTMKSVFTFVLDLFETVRRSTEAAGMMRASAELRRLGYIKESDLILERAKEHILEK